MNSAGPPDPLAISSTCEDPSIPSQPKKVRYSSAVSQEYCPISSPNASRRISVYSSSVVRRYSLS